MMKAEKTAKVTADWSHQASRRIVPPKRRGSGSDTASTKLNDI
jgi:hypothetical protein